RADLFDREGHQPAGNDGAAGRAERIDGAGDRESWLRSADGADRACRRRQGVVDERDCAQGVSRRGIAGRIGMKTGLRGVLESCATLFLVKARQIIRYATQIV